MYLSFDLRMVRDFPVPRIVYTYGKYHWQEMRDSTVSSRDPKLPSVPSQRLQDPIISVNVNSFLKLRGQVVRARFTIWNRYIYWRSWLTAELPSRKDSISFTIPLSNLTALVLLAMYLSKISFPNWYCFLWKKSNKLICFDRLTFPQKFQI